MPMYSECSLLFRFANQNFVRVPHISHACNMPRPSQRPWFDHPSDNLVKRTKYEAALKNNHISNPQTRTLIEKLIVTHLVKKFTDFCGNQRFIIVSTRTRQWSIF
jgi:hypothetical protein